MTPTERIQEKNLQQSQLDEAFVKLFKNTLIKINANFEKDCVNYKFERVKDVK